MATDLTIFLEDRPGTLANMGETLGEAGVNIDGGCGFACEGKGVIHILVEDASAAQRAGMPGTFIGHGTLDPVPYIADSTSNRSLSMHAIRVSSPSRCLNILGRSLLPNNGMGRTGYASCKTTDI